MPHVLGDEVGDDGRHADERAAIAVGEADQPHLAVRHFRRRNVVELDLGLVRARRFALRREEVLRVGVEEALQLGHVGGVEHAQAPLSSGRRVVAHAHEPGNQRWRGSSASRRPSPNRLNDSTSRKIASPGQIAIHGALST